MIPDDLVNWMMVFVRASAFFTLFPLFSGQNIPVSPRIALAALTAFLVGPTLPASPVALHSTWALVLAIAGEVVAGLTLGFVGRMVYYALEFTAAFLSTEIGLTLPASINPVSRSQSDTFGALLTYLATILLLSLDMHHWMLAAFQKTFGVLPIGGIHGARAVVPELVSRTSQIFVASLQMAAPVIAVSFAVTLVLALLSRAVPQMNVFSESFAIRILGGLTVFALTLNLMLLHLQNLVRRIPEDMMVVARLLGSR